MKRAMTILVSVYSIKYIVQKIELKLIKLVIEYLLIFNEYSQTNIQKHNYRCRNECTRNYSFKLCMQQINVGCTNWRILDTIYFDFGIGNNTYSYIQHIRVMGIAIVFGIFLCTICMILCYQRFHLGLRTI